MTTLGPYELNTIVTGDARILAESIPDSSIDLIFTDPIYQNIEDYEWLARTAARVLKPGGNLLAQSAKQWLPDIFQAMSIDTLCWQTLLAEFYPRASGTISGSKTMSGWKPYLWYSKGDRVGQWCFDRFYGKGQDRIHHKWGDSPEFYILYMERLTNPGDTVADFFTGGGTVPAVAKMLGVNYWACEIDPETAEKARRRVALTQPPLFVVQPEQPALFAQAPGSPLWGEAA